MREHPIKTLLAIAHVRKKTRGRPALENTHPFKRTLWGRHWVFAHNGTLLMHGRERTRPAARYQGYRGLFLLLAVRRRPTAFTASETFPTTDQSDSGASRSWSS